MKKIHGFYFILLDVAVFLKTKDQFKTFIFPKSENLIALKYLKIAFIIKNIILSCKIVDSDWLRDI